LFSRLLSENIKIKIYSTIILPIIWCGCETWSLILREDQRLRVFENMGLTRIFGPKRDDVIGGRRKLLNEEPHNLYSSGHRIIRSRRMRWIRHVGHMGRR
jgi:hypothetical protein